LILEKVDVRIAEEAREFAPGRLTISAARRQKPGLGSQTVVGTPSKK
jgi:hypothetical protein